MNELNEFNLLMSVGCADCFSSYPYEFRLSYALDVAGLVWGVVPEMRSSRKDIFFSISAMNML